MAAIELQFWLRALLFRLQSLLLPRPFSLAAIFLRPDTVFASLRLHPPLPRSLHRRRFRHQRMQRGHAIRFQLFRPLYRGGSPHRAGDDRHRRHRAHRGDYCAEMSAE